MDSLDVAGNHVRRTRKDGACHFNKPTVSHIKRLQAQANSRAAANENTQHQQKFNTRMPRSQLKGRRNQATENNMHSASDHHDAAKAPLSQRGKAPSLLAFYYPKGGNAQEMKVSSSQSTKK
jgi:hypothetical protein